MKQSTVRELDRLAVALALPIIVIVMPFLHVFANNVTNLQLPMQVYLEDYGLPLLGVAVLLYGLLKLSPQKLETWFIAIAFFVMLLTWLQTNFFVGSFGFLTGETPDWGKDIVIQWAQLLLLLVAGGLTLAYRQFLCSNIGFIAVLMVLSSIVYIPHLLEKAQRVEVSKYTFNKNGLYDFSKQKNVVIFILDSAQADVVDNILSTKPDIAAKFSGFTHFRDALSAFPKTYASIPAILSGEAYDNRAPLHTYLKRLYTEKSLPAKLTQAGFDSRLSSSSPHALFAHPLVAANVSDIDGNQTAPQEVKNNDSALLANLMLFRLTPHVFKSQVYNDGDFVIDFSRDDKAVVEARCKLPDEHRKYSIQRRSFDNLFLDEFQHCASANLDQPAFRFYHLYAPHAPYQLDENFEFIGPKPINRDWFATQTEGVLNVLGDVLQSMTAKGIMDNSLVIIASDHGEGEYNVGINYPDDLPERKSADKGVSPAIVRGGMSLLMVKKPDDSGDVRVSDAPVMLTDIPATVYDALGLDMADSGGRPVFSVIEGEDRQRIHRYYQFAGWNIDYIVPLTEYVVDGFGWFPESWSTSTASFDQSISQEFGGEFITLHRGGTLDNYKNSGWTEPGKVARGVTVDGASVRLAADGLSLLTVKHSLYSAEDTVVDVYADGSQVGSWAFNKNDGQRSKSIVLDKSGEFELRFRPRNADEPSVRFREIRIEPLTKYAYQLGTDVEFSDIGNSDKFRTYGWSRTEFWGTSTIGAETGLVLYLDQAVSAGLSLKVLLSGYVFPSSPVRQVELVINGKPVELLTVDHKAREEHEVLFSSELLNGERAVNITFRHINPIRQSELGVSHDTRLQSIAVRTLNLSVDQSQVAEKMETSEPAQ